jgi:hypothetical protein
MLCAVGRTLAGRVTMTLAVGMTLGFAGCLGGGGDDGPQPTQTPAASASSTPEEPLATVQSSVEDADVGGLRYDLMSLNRVGDAVVAQVRIVNEVDEEVAVGSGSRFGGSWTERPPGGYGDVSAFALFPAPPESTDAVTVIVPDGPPLPAVPIQDSDPPQLPGADAVPASPRCRWTSRWCSRSAR